LNCCKLSYVSRDCYSMDGLNEEGMHVHSPPVKGDGEREKEGGKEKEKEKGGNYLAM
jgi:hypothetical protein